MRISDWSSDVCSSDLAALAASDQLIAELITADTLVIGCPIYNFAIPAPLKAWLDQICRARVTFTYSDNGPKGLLTGKRAIVVMTSGGTAVSGEIDLDRKSTRLNSSN